MITLKRCYDCIAMLPISDYGKSRSQQDLLNPSCKACVRELGRVKYTLKFGHLKTDRQQIANNRIIRYHNRNILTHAFDNAPTFIYGFVPHTDISFKIYAGPSSLKDHVCIRLKLLDADVLDQEYALPVNDPNIVDNLMFILKGMSIRLEHSESDMLDSKQSIYYIGIL